MEIKSTLLNENDMRFVKASLEKISEEDNLQDFRVRMLEYINDTAEDQDDTFFFNMMIAIRFMNHPDHIAYTTPQRLIFLNSPGPIGQKIREWDFIYCHECLHQLWETFKVEEDIKKELGSCNHYLMNIASDCVINDYLQFHRGKQGPTEGVYPEGLEEKYGITYNRREDTQYTLYMKLLPKAKELEKDQQLRNIIDLGGETVEIDVSAGGGGGNSDDGTDNPQGPITIKNGKIKLKGKQQGGGGGSKNKPDITYDNVDIDTSELDADACSDEAQTSADSAQTSANIAQQNANAAKDNGDDDADAKQQAADQAQAAADKAKDAADRAKQAAQSGNTDAAREAADEAISAAQEAEDAAQKTMGGSGNGSAGSSKAINDMSADEAAASAQNDADVAKVTAQQLHNAANNVGDSNIDTDDLKKRLDAADKCAENAQKAANEAASAAKSGDDKAAQKAAKVAREQARKALEEVYGAEVDTSNPKKLDPKKLDGKSGTNKNSGQYQATGRNGVGSLDPCMTPIELEELTKELDKEIEKEKGKISSAVAPFIKQCKASKELKKDGLKITVTRGGKSWNADMTQAINAYVKARVAQHRRQYERTYSRPNRRGGIIKPGDIITPGRRIQKNHMVVNVAFYIDRSGSMDTGNAREHAFKSAYKICESLKRQYSRDKIVSEVAFKMYTFDSRITEVPFGQIATSGGTTLPFEDLFKFMADNTSQYLLNIIITDGETGMNESEVIKYIEQLDGKFIFVCNTHQVQVEKLAKKRPLDVKYIEADSTFSLD